MGSTNNGSNVWLNTLVHHDDIAQKVSLLPKRRRHFGGLPYARSSRPLGGTPLGLLCPTQPSPDDVSGLYIRSWFNVLHAWWEHKSWPPTNGVPDRWSTFHHRMERRCHELDLYFDQPHCWSSNEGRGPRHWWRCCAWRRSLRSVGRRGEDVDTDSMAESSDSFRLQTAGAKSCSGNVISLALPSPFFIVQRKHAAASVGEK